jgi:hypothetical protein
VDIDRAAEAEAAASQARRLDEQAHRLLAATLRDLARQGAPHQPAADADRPAEEVALADLKAAVERRHPGCPQVQVGDLEAAALLDLDLEARAALVAGHWTQAQGDALVGLGGLQAGAGPPDPGVVGPAQHGADHQIFGGQQLEHATVGDLLAAEDRQRDDLHVALLALLALPRGRRGRRGEGQRRLRGCNCGTEPPDTTHASHGATTLRGGGGPGHATGSVLQATTAAVAATTCARGRRPSIHSPRCRA